MRFNQLHDWDVAPAVARTIQAALAGQVDLADAISFDAIETIAGVDNAYVKENGETMACAAAVALAFPSLEVIETTITWRPVTFPYVPGLLSFREGPAVLAACANLAVEPDVVLFDGQGYAHPRRLGLASHLGLLLDRPAIGCAKSRLVGQFEEPERVFGAHTPLTDRGEVVGAAVRTRPRHKPLFVSPGHKVSVDTAVAIALACCRNGAFLPEPTRLAHEMVTSERRARIDATERSAPGPVS
ncbi:MAG: deoxyribonuclease V [Chloroflexi bacterium]|nr:deoxyribonuclease V [Chloroflexota bacterium]